MNNRKTPISTTISIVGTITFISCVIIGFFYGIAYGIEGSQNAKAFGGVIGVFFGMLLRMGIGFLIGLPTASILWGFARIVAWYEAVPPGYAYGMQPTDDGSAPAARPMTYAPVPAKPATAMPQRPEARDRSDVPVAHHEVSSQVPDVAAPSSHWKCPTCGSIQPDYVKHCRRCGEYKPANLTPAAPKPAPVKRNAHATTWQCTCGAENPVSRGTCDSCGGAKPFQRSRFNR